MIHRIRAWDDEFQKIFTNVYILPDNELMIDLDGNGIYDIVDAKEFIIESSIIHKGQEIFEGDIINSKLYGYGVVSFDNILFTWFVNGKYLLPLSDWIEKGYKVCGNIHLNSDLVGDFYGSEKV